MMAGRECLIHGFPEGAATRKGESVDWKLATMFDEALFEAGVERPQDIPGMDEISTIYWFIQDISPPIFFLKRFKEKTSPAVAERMKKSTQGQLEWYLKKWGVKKN
jgi:hypothetical protein